MKIWQFSGNYDNMQIRNYFSAELKHNACLQKRHFSENRKWGQKTGTGKAKGKDSMIFLNRCPFIFAHLSISKYSGLICLFIYVWVWVCISKTYCSVWLILHTQKHTHTRYTTAAVGLVRPDSLAAPALYLPQTIRLRRGGCLSVCHSITTHLSEWGTGTDVDSELHRCVCVCVRVKLSGKVGVVQLGEDNEAVNSAGTQSDKTQKWMQMKSRSDTQR